MSDVIVRIDLEDDSTESKLFEAVDQFALSRSSKTPSGEYLGDAPEIMVKSVPEGEIVRKSVIFQDQQAAEEFLYFWRRMRNS